MDKPDSAAPRLITDAGWTRFVKPEIERIAANMEATFEAHKDMFDAALDEDSYGVLEGASEVLRKVVADLESFLAKPAAASPRQPEGPLDVSGLMRMKLTRWASELETRGAFPWLIEEIREALKYVAQPADAAPLDALREGRDMLIELQHAIMLAGGHEDRVELPARLRKERTIEALTRASVALGSIIAKADVGESKALRDAYAENDRLRAALAAAPRDRPDARRCVTCGATFKNGRRLDGNDRCTDDDYHHGPFEPATAAPLGAPDARLDEAREEGALAERKAWEFLIADSIKAAERRMDEDPTVLQMAVAVLRNLGKSIEDARQYLRANPSPEKQSPAAAASLEVEALVALRAFVDAGCACDPREIEGGHRVDCRYVELAAAARAVLRRSGDEA